MSLLKKHVLPYYSVYDDDMYDNVDGDVLHYGDLSSYMELQVLKEKAVSRQQLSSLPDNESYGGLKDKRQTSLSSPTIHEDGDGDDDGRMTSGRRLPGVDIALRQRKKTLSHFSISSSKKSTMIVISSRKDKQAAVRESSR